MAVNWNSYYSPQDSVGGIITGNPALASLQQRYVQEAKDKSDEETKFNSSLAKMNFGGAKPADYGDLQSGYNAIVQAHQAARAERDPQKKGVLNQQVNALQNDLLYKTAQSKEANTDIHKYSDLPLTHPDNIHPDFIKNLSGLANTSTFAPNYQDAKNTFENNAFLPKSVDWGKTFKDISDPLIKKGETSQIITDPVTKELVTQKQVTNSLDKDAYTTAIANSLKDPIKLRQAQGAFGGNSPVETAQKMVDASYGGINGSLDNSKTQGTPFETGATKSNRILSREQELALWKQKHGIGENGAQLTPYQVLVAGNRSNGTPGMLQGNVDAMKRLQGLAPKAQYGNTPIPEPTIDPATGEHVLNFPAQVVKDDKNAQLNDVLRKKYAATPEKQGGVLGFGGTPIPFEKSKAFGKLLPEFKEKKPAVTYRLNPADPKGYLGQVDALSADQNIKPAALNSLLGGKGGRGEIPLNAPAKKVKVTDVSSIFK